MIHDSEINLYEFYRNIGLCSAVSFIDRGNFSIVSGKRKSWPQMIFDLNLTDKAGIQLKNVFSETAEISDVRFAVSDSRKFTSEDQLTLRNSTIFPIETWSLMEINSTVNLKFQQRDGIIIKSLTVQDEILAFTSLVNTYLMASVKVEELLFREVVHHPEIMIYGLFIKEELVSGLLSFKGSEEVAGLYFIVTKSEMRGMGLASDLIGSVIYSFFENGIKKVVLQAVPKSVSLYTRLGLSQIGRLAIFWKQNYEPTTNT